MYKVISCGIFKPYIESVSLNFDLYDIEYLEIQQHNQPKKLSQTIQDVINQSQNYDKIIVLYGLCGGALLSIKTSHTPLIVVCVHDCMSILLGSKKKYNDFVNKNKLLNWSCYSLKINNFMNDSLSQWEEKYDEETIEYLKSILILEDNIYISFDLLEEQDYLKTEKKIIHGDLRFLEEILTCTSHDIMYVYEQDKIYQTADERVIDIVRE
jgi:Protein of unknown function (DUF1638).